MKNTTIILIGLKTIPLVHPGDDLSALIINAAQNEGVQIDDGDVVLIAQKVVSKAEGALVDLSTVTASAEAKALAAQTGRDERFCQVVLDESERVIEIKGRVIVTNHRLGFRCTSAGVDKSNIEGGGTRFVTTLPKDPDASAVAIRTRLISILNPKEVAVIITDTFGRPDRLGSVGLAIGCAGLAPMASSSDRDLFGNPSTPEIARADELASAASLLMGQGDERIPVVIAKGAFYVKSSTGKLLDLLIYEH